MQNMGYSRPTVQTQEEVRMSHKAWIFVSCVIIMGAMVLTESLAFWPAINWVNFGVYLIVALLGSGLKVQLPGITGTMSIGFFLVLVGITSLSLPEILVVACLGVLLQYSWRAPKRLHVHQALFNMASIVITVAVSYLVFHSGYLQTAILGRLLRPFILGVIYFIANTLLIAGAIALTEGRRVGAIWCGMYWWSLPYYLLGAAGAVLFDMAQRQVGWQTAIFLLPLAYVVFRSYRLEVGHLRTIEAC